MRTAIISITVAALALLVGYQAGRASHQNVNDLCDAGYTVIDPEGYKCDRWHESPLSIIDQLAAP